MKPGGSPRGEISNPSGPAVARRANGDAEIIAWYAEWRYETSFLMDTSPTTSKSPSREARSSIKWLFVFVVIGDSINLPGQGDERISRYFHRWGSDSICFQPSVCSTRFVFNSLKYVSRIAARSWARGGTQ